MDIDSEIRQIITDIENDEREGLTLYEDLAPVYDYLYGEEYDYEKQSEYVQQATGELSDVHIIEGGCGTGRLLEQLATDIPDAEITGVELHEGMASLSQERVAEYGNVDVEQGDMFEVSGEFDVFALFGVMAHVPENDREEFFEQVYKNLSEGGAFVFDYKHPEYDVDGRYSPWSADTGTYTVSSHYITLYEDGETYYAVSYEFEENESGEVYYAGELMEVYFQYPDTLEDELHDVGFSDVVVHGNREENGVVVAQKTSGD